MTTTHDMYELAGHFEVKYKVEKIVTEQTYPGLRHVWIVFARH